MVSGIIFCKAIIINIVDEIIHVAGISIQVWITARRGLLAARGTQNIIRRGGTEEIEGN